MLVEKAGKTKAPNPDNFGGSRFDVIWGLIFNRIPSSIRGYLPKVDALI
ncbi:hypothetical protein [Nostoc sp. T09]|nr:hypothetical protein [Nostoc sp. T09]